jgi:BspA type Leucine rich repeat region (6 copies)
VFQYCTSLTSVTIGNSVIGENEFAQCYSLTNVTIGNSVTSIGGGGVGAFAYCTNLTSVHFTGNAPSPTNDSFVFYADPAIVYYLPGTTGWGAFFDGLPTAPWFLPNPQILNHSAGFGVHPGGFGFTISWATNASVVVEAATNLTNPVWIPVSTNALTSGTNYFSDPQWKNYPERFYRAVGTFTVGGTLTGLRAGETVTLQDNGSDNLTLSTNGTFTFPTALPNGHAYSVTVSGTSGLPGTKTTGTVTANGSGTISGANVTNVTVFCRTALVFTGDLDVDMYNAAVADGTANGGVPGVMLTENGGPFRVTADGFFSNEVGREYSDECVFTLIVGTGSCSSTTLPSGLPVIQFGNVLECGFGPYGY